MIKINTESHILSQSLCYFPRFSPIGSYSKLGVCSISWQVNETYAQWQYRSEQLPCFKTIFPGRGTHSAQSLLKKHSNTAAITHLKVHGHGQTHSRNFCRFKLDI